LWMSTLVLFRLLVDRELQAVYSSSPDLLVSAAANLATIVKNIPHVLEIRDIWPLSLVELGGVPVKHPIVKLLAIVESWLHRSSEKVITVLEGSLQHLRDAGARQPLLVPNGVRLDQFDEVQANTELKDHRMMVVHVGAHNRSNPMSPVLDAMKSERIRGRVRLVCVGGGEDIEQLKDQVARQDLTEDVVFTGPMKKSKAWEVVKSADVGIVSRQPTDLYKSGFAFMKLYDYLAAGLPILCIARLPHGNRISQSGCMVQVEPESHEELVAAFENLIQMETASRRQMGQGGRRFVEENGDYGSLFGRLADAIEAVS
jgi:glycosyltransferase involved in cell wall biosynthesis